MWNQILYLKNNCFVKPTTQVEIGYNSYIQKWTSKGEVFFLESVLKFDEESEPYYVMEKDSAFSVTIIEDVLCRIPSERKFHYAYKLWSAFRLDTKLHGPSSPGDPLNTRQVKLDLYITELAKNLYTARHRTLTLNERIPRLRDCLYRQSALESVREVLACPYGEDREFLIKYCLQNGFDFHKVVFYEEILPGTPDVSFSA